MSYITTLNNFNEFKGFVGKYGFSMSNFYDVQFQLSKSVNNPRTILNNIFTLGMTNNTNVSSTNFLGGLMRVYAEECTIPGYSISTGEYRITNTPTLKYAYGVVNNEITISFILDADSEIRRIFDAWGNFIYGSVALNSATLSNSNLNMNTISDLGRTRYRDEYVVDITIIKFERHRSSKKNTRNNSTQTDFQSNFYSNQQIVPDYKGDLLPGFGKPFPTYSIRLMNAFPTTVSAIPLSSGSSQLVKVQVTFEYELAVPSSQTGKGSTEINSSWRSVAN